MYICSDAVGLMGWAKQAVMFLVCEMNLLVQNHNHYSTANAIIFQYSVVQEREIEGMLC